MRVWLVNPRTEGMITTELPGYVSKEVGRFPPLGLLALAAFVRSRRGDELRVLDMPAEDMSYDRLADEARRGEPDVVGITGTTHNLVEIKRAAAQVKDARPQAVVVFGGPHVEAFPAEATALPGVDFTVRGEGELPFSLLLDALERGDREPAIPGLGRKDGSGAVLHEPGPAPDDLDSLPYPARDLVDPDRYFYVLGKRSSFTTILSTRGCPYRCIFCSTPRGRYRMRSPGNILDEVEACLAAGAREFHFIDDTFNAARQRLGVVSEEILRRGLAIRWSFRGRVDTLTEEEIVLAKRSGCQRMHVGIENGSDEGLRLLRKGITTAQVERALIWARRHGIATAAYFLIGCPHEKTREDVLRTIDFACRVDPDFALFNILTIYPHTELHDQAVARGLIGAGHWRDFARDPNPGFRMRFWEEHFSPEELVSLLETAYRRFYMRPRVIWRNLVSLGSLGELRHKAAAGLALLRGRGGRRRS